jgi:outer membrane protein assembly factor BamB
MSNPDTTITRCPSCGAPINMGETRGTCDYCETVVERQNTTAGGEPKFVRVHVGTARKRAKTPPSNAGNGCMVALLAGVFLFVGTILVASGTIPIAPLTSALGITNQGWPLFGPERITDLVRVVPRDAADDMLVFIDRDEDVTLGLIDSTGRALRWQSAPLSKDGRQAVLALGPDTVYLADQTRLLALRLLDGTPAWQTTLPVELPSSCDRCLTLLNDHLIAWQKDGTVQAFDTRNGQTAWSRRLEGSPRPLVAAGGWLAVGQPAEGQTGGEIQLLDPSSGEVARRITPGCARNEEGDEAEFYADSFFLPTDDGAALLALFDNWDGCAQRWNLDADGPAWQTWLEGDSAPSSWGERQVIMDRGRLFFVNDGVLSKLDTATGAVNLLVSDDEYTLVPLFARDDIVVVKATPDWDYSRHSLWGIDATTGARRWQYDVAAKEWFGDSGFNEWGAQLTPGGVAVVLAPGDSRELIVERLDLKTGASIGRQVMVLEGSGSTTVWDNRWTDRRAWLVIESTLYVVDLMSGEITVQPL